MIPARNRHRIRFSLRKLFVVVAVICVVLGYQWRWIDARRSMLQSGKLEAFDDDGLSGLGLPTKVRAPGILWLFGERGYPNLWQKLSSQDMKLTPAEISERQHMQQLFPEASIEGFWIPPPTKPRLRYGSDYDGYKL